ncbi:MAG: hypothetical protein N3B12_06320 [Armatimonadetes bacterium]|nr:hypothetical protein [Armatimonadota bacterium]
MNKFALTFLVSTAFSIGMASSASLSKPQTLHYEVKMKSLSFGNMGTKKMYIKGNKMRWETNAAYLPLTVIKNEKGTFLVSPFKKTAARYAPGSNRNDPKIYLPGPLGSPKAFLREMRAVKRGREKVGREVCDVYSYYAPASDRKCKLWVSINTGKPVKLVLEGEKKLKDTIVATYTKFVLGGHIPDSLFELPKGYVVRNMPPPPKLKPDQAISKADMREPGS